MLTQIEIRQFFEAKETISKEKDKKNDILLMYYKKIGKSLQNDIESERKGLTVNIKENPFKLDSSIITIYGANNLTQLQSIGFKIGEFSYVPDIGKDVVRGLKSDGT